MSITDILANAAAIVTIFGGGAAVIRFIRSRGNPKSYNVSPQPLAFSIPPLQSSSQTASLLVIRQPSSPFFLSSFQLKLDGIKIGAIRNGNSCRCEIPTGHHTLFVHAGSISSPLLSFDATSGENITLFCQGKAGFWTNSILLWKQR